jgi:hypothetical protein
VRAYVRGEAEGYRSAVHLVDQLIYSEEGSTAFLHFALQRLMGERQQRRHVGGGLMLGTASSTSREVSAV